MLPKSQLSELDFKSVEAAARQGDRSGTIIWRSIFKMSVWLIMQKRIVVKVTVGLKILTFESCSDQGYLGLRLYQSTSLTETPCWHQSWLMSIRYSLPVNTTVNINAKTLFLQCCFGTMNWYRIYCTLRTASENLKRSMKLILYSLLLMNDNTIKSLYPGLHDYRGKLNI